MGKKNNFTIFNLIKTGQFLFFGPVNGQTNRNHLFGRHVLSFKRFKIADDTK